MIITECKCGELVIAPFESGDEPGFYRYDCKCGTIVMVECSSIDRRILYFDNEKELNKFKKWEGLK